MGGAGDVGETLKLADDCVRAIWALGPVLGPAVAFAWPLAAVAVGF